MAIVRMRRTASASDRLGLVRRRAPGLQAQQRRDRLQVVLHPVVDLADGGVLRQQQPVPLAQLADVPQQQHPAGDRRRPAMIGMQRVSSVTSVVWSTSSITGSRALEGLPHGGVVEAQLGQALPDGVGVDADPVQRRHRVRRRVLHPGVGVEHHHAVAHAGRHRARCCAGPRTGSCPRRSSPRSGGRWRGRCAPARPGWRPVRGDHSFVSTAMTRPWRRTGMASSRVASGMPSTVDLALDHARPTRAPRAAAVARTRWPTSPTQSER